MKQRPSNVLKDTGSPQAVRVRIKIILIPMIWALVLYAGVIVIFFIEEINIPTYWKPAVSVACFIPLQMMCFILYFNWKGLKIRYN